MGFFATTATIASWVVIVTLISFAVLPTIYLLGLDISSRRRNARQKERKRMYAVVECSVSDGYLYVDASPISHKDILEAEKERISLLDKNPHLNPQNVQVLQYSV